MGTGLSLTIAGLAIATAVSLESVLSGKKNGKLKGLLIGLTLAGSMVGGVSAYNDAKDKKHDAEIAELKYKETKAKLDDQTSTLKYINQTVDDLGALNELSAGDKFYVRLAAGSKNDMEHSLGAIESRFRGAHLSGLVAVRSLRPGCSEVDPKAGCWGLVFGSHLTLAAAEVFARFANENGFPPPQQHSVIMPEPR